MSTKGYRKGNALLDKTVGSLLSITDEYGPQWSDIEREGLAVRFGVVVGMFGEACRVDTRERQQRRREGCAPSKREN